MFYQFLEWIDFTLFVLKCLQEKQGILISRLSRHSSLPSRTSRTPRLLRLSFGLCLYRWCSRFDGSSRSSRLCLFHRNVQRRGDRWQTSSYDISTRLAWVMPSNRCLMVIMERLKFCFYIGWRRSNYLWYKIQER